MTTFVYIVTAVGVVLGVGVVVWSFFDTRNKYYKEYLDRKEK